MTKTDELLQEAKKRIDASPTANVIFATTDGHTTNELADLADKARAAGYKVKVNATGDTIIVLKSH